MLLRSKLRTPCFPSKESGRAHWKLTVCDCDCNFTYRTIQKNNLVAALDSLDQGVSGLPANRVRLKENSFHFEVPVVDGVFEGKLEADEKYIEGKLVTNGSGTSTGVPAFRRTTCCTASAESS